MPVISNMVADTTKVYRHIRRVPHRRPAKLAICPA
jgi:hypothetical protein